MTEDEMVGRHHHLNGHESEQIPGDSERQGILVCCSPWGLQRVGHHLVTEQQHGDSDTCGHESTIPFLLIITTDPGLCLDLRRVRSNMS